MPIVSTYEETYTIGQLGRKETEVVAGSTLEIVIEPPGGTVGKTFTSQFQHVTYVSPTVPAPTPGVVLAGSFTVTVLNSSQILLSTPTDSLLNGRYLYDVVSTGGGRSSVSSVREFKVLIPVTLASTGSPVLPPGQGAATLVNAHNNDPGAHNGLLSGGATYSVTFTDSDLDSNGLLTRNHGLSTRPDNVLILADDGQLVSPASVYSTSSIVTVDLYDFRPLTGVWQMTADAGPSVTLPPEDSDVLAFNTATSTAIPAIRSLVLGLKAAGLWGLLTNIYPFVGATTAARSVNLKTPGSNNLVAGGTESYDNLGLVCNGLGPTFVAPVVNSVAGRKFYVGMYLSSASNSTDKDLQAVESSAAVLNLKYTDGLCYPEFFNATSVPSATLPSLGLIHYTRSPEAGTASLYANSVLVRTRAFSSATGSNCLSWRIGSPSTRTYGIVLMGETLTDSQMVAISSIVNSFCSSINR